MVGGGGLKLRVFEEELAEAEAAAVDREEAFVGIMGAMVNAGVVAEVVVARVR